MYLHRLFDLYIDDCFKFKVLCSITIDPAAPSGYDFKQIQSLMSLTLSDNVEMQKNAAVGFLRMSKNCE